VSTPEKRGFFSRVNPLNLFKRKSKEKEPTPLPARTEAGTIGEPEGRRPSGPGSPDRLDASGMDIELQVDADGRFRRYAYRYASAPAAGDGRASEQAVERAQRARLRGQTTAAIEAYRQAVEADPSNFNAQFNLGVLALEAGQSAQALLACEAATRIDPSSVPARYNLALALKSAGYPVDAANELLRALRLDPDDTRVRLTLGNLYAQQFRDKARARQQYLRVLELDPGHPQASAIHFWLVQNPE
jgi:tetratricopeptide (TPR) repeat protein